MRRLTAVLAAAPLVLGPGGAPAAATDTDPAAPTVDPFIDQFTPDPGLQETPEAEHAAREVTAHEHLLWAPTSSIVRTIVVRDAPACALPEGAEGPSADGSRGVRLNGALAVGEGREAVPIPEPTVYYADPDDLVIEIDEALQAPPGETVTVTVECLTTDDTWVPVGEGSYFIEFGTDVLPFGLDFPTAVDFGPVVENGRVPLSLAEIPADGPVGYPVTDLDIADVRAGLDGEPATVTGTDEDAEVVFPEDAEPGLHLLTLSYAEPALWEVTVPVINGYAAPAVEPPPVAQAEGDGDGVPRLEDLRTDPVTLLIALAVTTAAIGVVWLLVGFPSDILNKSIEGNQGRVRGWWNRLRAFVTGRPGERRALLTLSAGTAFVVFWILSAALPVLLNWNPAPEATPVLDFLGLLIAVFAVTVVYAWVVNARDWSWSQVPGRFEVLPAGLAIVAVCSAASAAADFEPGYFYGLIAGFAAVADRAAKLDLPEAERDGFVRENEGRATRLGAFSVLVLSVVCYLFWNSLSAVVEDGGAPFGVLLMEKALFATTVLGVQTVVFGLLPMRFLDGHRLWRWGRAHWALAFTPGLFVFVYLLHMHPDQVAGKTAPESLLSTAALFVGFGVLSLVVWAFFVWRARRAPADRPQPVAVAASTPGEPSATDPARAARADSVEADAVAPTPSEETDEPLTGTDEAAPEDGHTEPVPVDPEPTPPEPASGPPDTDRADPVEPEEDGSDEERPSEAHRDTTGEPEEPPPSDPDTDIDGDPAEATEPTAADPTPDDAVLTEERSRQD
ncbi:FGLLP motif-containing membrane protein [Nocardiopsis sp. NPDC049922]|uniref:FGLLP motif-containing membrane protein n=1 Tax=Nocardiopsis sp. NPDC049922 TaxID=3155157 RepID=UPI0033E41E66